MLALDSFSLTDAGRVRNHNEDSLGAFLPPSDREARTRGWLFVLADGMGGEAHGEVASKASVDTLTEGFRSAPAGEAHTSLLQRLVQQANTRVYELGRAASPGGTRMGTTLVACAFRFDRLTVAHIGDSRCYLIRHNHLTQLTRDHTVVADQIRMGILSATEAETAETRHILSRSLGCDMIAAVDVSEHALLKGDTILLCSDGLHNSVGAPEMTATVAALPLDSAARRLVALANERDGSDNISVQLIRVRSTERMGMYRGRPYKLR